MTGAAFMGVDSRENEMVAFHAICNRELRVIPRGWRHPGDPPFPLLPAEWYPDTAEKLAEWYADHEGATEPPPRGRYMPSVAGRDLADTEIVMYETTSEGTPKTPAYPNTPEGRFRLVSYCAAHCSIHGATFADAETWAGVLFGGEMAVVDSETNRVEVFSGERGGA